MNTTETDDVAADDSSCEDPPHIYMSSLGIQMAVPEWEAAVTATTLSLLIILTVVGNILVILSVFTYKPLRIVQNFFIVSLAVADLTVALLVMPFNVAYSILGRWEFGIHTCKMWLTCDVLCCTASILNLCAIALDRYWAITDPINYAQKRTLKRVLMMIAGIWILSLIISSPPLIGWNDWPKNFSSDTPCQLTSQKGYVIYSSLGSFYIPLVIMTIVYIEIFIATRRRLRERAKASKINTILGKNHMNVISNEKNQHEPVTHDADSVSSENHTDHHPQDVTTTTSSSNGKQKAKKHKKKRKKSTNIDEHTNKHKLKFLAPILPAEDSVTDNNQENSSSSNQRKNSSGVEDGGGSAATPLTTTTTDSPVSRNASHRGTGEHQVTAGDEPIVASSGAQMPSVITTTTATSMSKKSGAVYQFIEEKQRISLSKERRAARTLGIIMGVFVVCWLPFFLMYVILPFCPTCCATKKFINFITWLGYINSALNPIIYTIFNLEYRRAFKKLLGIKA